MNFIDSLRSEDVSLASIQKPYLELCERQNTLQTRLAIVQRNLSKCSDENIKFAEEVQSSRELSSKAAEKLSRITSLCLDLRKRLEVSSTQKAIDDERHKRMELNDSFAVDVEKISKRIEDVASNKQINSVVNESLRLQLTSSIDNFHVAENPAEVEESSFESAYLQAEDSITQSTELSMMEYEDYLGHVGSSIVMQVALRELLSSYNGKFLGFQNRLAKNNEVFESHRKRIDDVSEIAKAKHIIRSEAMLDIKALNKALKAQSILYTECQKNIEKEKSKEEKMLKLIEIFVSDIASKELELSALQKIDSNVESLS